MGPEDLKEKFRPKDTWQRKKIKKYYGNYFSAYWAFQNAFIGRTANHPPLKGNEIKIIEYLKDKAFLGKRVPVSAFINPIQLYDMDKRDKFLMRMVNLKDMYLNVSIEDYLVAVSLMYDLKITPRSLKDLIEKERKRTDRDKLIVEMKELKAKYNDVPAEEYFATISTLFGLNVTPGSIRDLIKKGKKQ